LEIKRTPYQPELIGDDYTGHGAGLLERKLMETLHGEKSFYRRNPAGSITVSLSTVVSNVVAPLRATAPCPAGRAERQARAVWLAGLVALSCTLGVWM
jgi:hypothetical protein